MLAMLRVPFKNQKCHISRYYAAPNSYHKSSGIRYQCHNQQKYKKGYYESTWSNTEFFFDKGEIGVSIELL